MVYCIVSCIRSLLLSTKFCTKQYLHSSGSRYSAHFNADMHALHADDILHYYVCLLAYSFEFLNQNTLVSSSHTVVEILLRVMAYCECFFLRHKLQQL